MIFCLNRCFEGYFRLGLQKNVTPPQLSGILGVDLSIHFRYTDFQQHYVTVFYQARIIVEKVGIQ